MQIGDRVTTWRVLVKGFSLERWLTVMILIQTSHRCSMRLKSFILMKPFSDLSCPLDTGIVILEETTPIRRELFHHRSRVTNQNNFVLICSDLPSARKNGSKPIKCPLQGHRATAPPSLIQVCMTIIIIIVVDVIIIITCCPHLSGPVHIVFSLLNS